MSSSVQALASASPKVPCGHLPPQVRALYVTTPRRTGAELAAALAADGASEVLLEEALGFAAGLELLRDQAFDAVLVSHEPGELDALAFVEGLRAGGSEEPLLVLGAADDDEFSAHCFEVGADAYLCVHTTTVRALLWIASRAIERHQLIRENRRLQHAERHRLQLEQREAERRLTEQRALAHPDDDAGGSNVALPEQLAAHYRELLRAQVIMGSGNLSGELAALAEVLAATGIDARQTLDLHVTVLGEQIRSLGSRSARHVVARADLLVVELLVQLAEQYRRRYTEALHPPSQLLLPGFDLFESPTAAR